MTTADNSNMESFNLKLRAAHDPINGQFEVSISLPQLSMEVEASGPQLRDVLKEAGNKLASKLNDAGYAVTFDDIAIALEAAMDAGAFTTYNEPKSKSTN